MLELECYKAKTRGRFARIESVLMVRPEVVNKYTCTTHFIDHPRLLLKGTDQHERFRRSLCEAPNDGNSVTGSKLHPTLTAA